MDKTVNVIRTGLKFENGQYVYNLEILDKEDKGTGHFITFTAQYSLMVPLLAKFTINYES